MSMTAVPISIVYVRVPTAARSGNGEPSWRAKWCTRKYAPSRPSSSAASASSIDCRRTSDAVRALESRDGVQCPKERKPSFFTKGPQRMKRLLYPSELRGHGRACEGLLRLPQGTAGSSKVLAGALATFYESRWRASSTLSSRLVLTVHPVESGALRLSIFLSSPT